MEENNQQTENEILEDILDILTFIKTNYISREKYNNLNGNILEKINYQNKEKLDENLKSIDRKDYNLYLPDNINYDDKIKIFNLLEEKFSNILKESNEGDFVKGTEKIKAKIFYAVDNILNNNNKLEENLKNNKTDENSNEIQNSDIENNNEKLKYLKELYKKIFDEELPDLEKIKEELKNLNLKDKLSFKRDYVTLAKKIQKGENFEEIINDEIDYHFEELFFRKGVNNLRFGLNVMTQGEQALLINKKLNNSYKEKNDFKDLKENNFFIYKYNAKSNIDKKTTKTTIINQKTEKLEKNEKLLRAKIGIDKLKIELNYARINKNKSKINDIELKATRKILKELHNNFPYQTTNNDFGDKPSKIQQSKEIFCVGHSIVGHSFLEELKIKHKGIYIPEHSALEVNIGGKKYYFDGVFSNKLHEFTYGEKKGEYRKINIIFKDIDNKSKSNKIKEINNKLNENTIETGLSIYNIYGKNLDVEKSLLSNIYNNKTNIIKTDIKKTNESIHLINKAIKINPKSSMEYLIKGNIFFNIQKNSKALSEYQKVLQLEPNNINTLNNIGTILLNTGKNEEATKYFNKILEIEPNNTLAYLNKGIIFYKIGKYEDSVKNYELAIKFDTDNQYGIMFLYKGYALSNLQKHKDAILAYSKAIDFNNMESSAYINKGMALKKIDSTNIKISKLYEYTGYSLNGEKYSILDNNKDKNEIDKFIKEGQYKKLTLFLKSKENIIENNSKEYIKRGNIFTELGSFDKAINMYQKALLLNPKNKEALYNKGYSLLKEGKYQKSIELYTTIINSKPNYTYLNKNNKIIAKPNNILLLNNLGYAYSKIGKHAEAIKTYTKILNINSNNFYAYNNKGEALLKLNYNNIKISELYKYTSGILRGEILLTSDDYQKEKDEINIFIRKGEYKNLAKYLQKLEKEN